MWDRSENQITLILIRHGATKSNEERRYLGKTDESLSKEGAQQLVEYKKMQKSAGINNGMTLLENI